MVVQTLVLGGMLVCAVLAIQARRLLISALWLAGCSALLSLALSLLGALEVAVVELSVGAGLVTIIFVFAINIAGEETIAVGSLIPRPVAWILMGLFLLLLAWLTVPGLVVRSGARDALPFVKAIWEERAFDTILQVALIFSGVLGSLGLLSEQPNAAARRDHGGAA